MQSDYFSDAEDDDTSHCMLHPGGISDEGQPSVECICLAGGSGFCSELYRAVFRLV